MNQNEPLLRSPKPISSLRTETLEDRREELKALIATLGRCVCASGVASVDEEAYREALSTGRTLLQAVEGEIGRRAVAEIKNMAQGMILPEEGISATDPFEREGRV